MPIRSGVKDRSHIFAKAEEYLEKIDEELEKVENGSPSYLQQKYEKLKQDFMEAESAAEVVSVYAIDPKEMEQEKTKELSVLIESNNIHNLSDEAVIKFFIELYTFHDWKFEDFDKSWHDALHYVHEHSNNEQLIGLVDSLFDNSIPEAIMSN